MLFFCCFFFFFFFFGGGGEVCRKCRKKGKRGRGDSMIESKTNRQGDEQVNRDRNRTRRTLAIKKEIGE